MHNRFWFLLSKKLNNTATDPEMSELGALVSEQADRQYTLQKLTTIWESNNEEEAAEPAFERHLERMEALGHDTFVFKPAEVMAWKPFYKPAGRSWMKPVLVIAILLIAISSWLYFGRAGNENAAGNTQALATPPLSNTIATNSGDRSRMVLPDGTIVWLNAESKLEYSKEYGKTNRDVKLSGEAYFDVVKNINMPFTIQTNKIHIKVTGTAFNVKAYPGEKLSETSLIRGRVEVTVNARPDEKYILKPNEKLVVRDEVLVQPVNKAVFMTVDKKIVNEPLIQLGYLNYVGNDSAAVETAWVYNKLIFDDESFEAIARKMERWFGVTIQINDPLIAAQHLTYTIKNETIAQALGNMQYAFRFHYSINGKTITITK